jgi:hypothetical protein
MSEKYKLPNRATGGSFSKEIRSIAGPLGRPHTFADLLEIGEGMPYLDRMTKEYWGVYESLLKSAAKCLDAVSVRALGAHQLADAAQSRVRLLAQRANEGQLTADEGNEYDRFVELSDIIATQRLKAESQIKVARE